MKKIVALALCLVLALSLCATAMAADVKYDLYSANDLDTPTKTNVSVTKTKAVAVNDDNIGHMAYETVDGKDYITCAKADADAFLKVAGKKVIDRYYMELPNNTAEYRVVTAFTAVGTKCGQQNWDTDETYYKYVDDDDNATYYVADDDGSVNLMVNGKLVYGEVIAENKVSHKWEANTIKDGKYVDVKCSKCGAVATLYPTAVAAGDDAVYLAAFDGYIVEPAAGTTPTTSGNKVDSAKTFDAGIALYVGMSISAVAGSAVVIGKKKEF